MSYSVLNEAEIVSELIIDELSELSDFESDHTEAVEDSSEGETEDGIEETNHAGNSPKKYMTSSGRVYLAEALQCKRDFET